MLGNEQREVKRNAANEAACAMAVELAGLIGGLGEGAEVVTRNDYVDTKTRILIGETPCKFRVDIETETAGGPYYLHCTGRLRAAYQDERGKGKNRLIGKDLDKLAADLVATYKATVREHEASIRRRDMANAADAVVARIVNEVGAPMGCLKAKNGSIGRLELVLSNLNTEQAANLLWAAKQAGVFKAAEGTTTEGK
jgi:hypothetical protein